MNANNPFSESACVPSRSSQLRQIIYVLPCPTNNDKLYKSNRMSKEEAKEGNVYVVEPIEISSESDPSEL